MFFKVMATCLIVLLGLKRYCRLEDTLYVAGQKFCDLFLVSFSVLDLVGYEKGM